MKTLEDKITGLMLDAMTDGFNRSFKVLQKEKAIKATKKLDQYKGVGSELYDKVTEQMEFTIDCFRPAIRNAINESKSQFEDE